MKIVKVRKEFTTRGADPTVVVEWVAEGSNGERIAVSEFQNVYVGTLKDKNGITELSPFYAQLVHESMERIYELQRDLDSEWNTREER